jgi:hypothetical protein
MLNSKKSAPKHMCIGSNIYTLFGSVYLISTTVANNVKAKFYNEDLPALEDVRFNTFPRLSFSEPDTPPHFL